VLEAGCGTGRILLPTLAAGVDIDGFDIEPAMIERLRAKATARGLNPTLAVADMRDVALPRRYARVTIPFRAFMHLLTTEDQLKALGALRAQIAPGGTLLFNLFYPGFDYIVTHDGKHAEERTFTRQETGETVALASTPRYDRVRQRLSVEREVTITAPQGAPVVHRYGFTLRWTYPYELGLLLDRAGFARHEIRGGFDGRPLERDTDEMVVTAWRE
jgi:SAM-dependent methyltransferase